MLLNTLITMAEQDSVHRRRLALARTGSKKILDKLFKDIGPAYRDRPGGYLRLLRLNPRAGDNAPMALVELVGRGEDQEGEQETS